MRKIMMVGALALMMSVGVAGPSAAGQAPSGSSAFGASSVVWQQRYMAWLFGSATNPLMQDGLCGQTIDGMLFLNAATVPDFEATCTVKPGTKILASPGGTIEWEPTNGTTDAQLLAQLALDSASIQNAAGSLDGRALDEASSCVLD
jgi:hypothetical protein